MVASGIVHQQVEKALAGVRDPSTGMTLADLPLVRELAVDEDGRVTITLRPSSPVCPLIFKLGDDIKQAVLQVPEVRKIFFKIEGHRQAAMVEEYLAPE
ncbi:MAG: iron-sulfur cluster assembly protein [Deltaproteobacteria bacterium]|nr:iron-sulfur cluster assembly protein [Deltaproteobacteria bacterium]